MSDYLHAVPRDQRRGVVAGGDEVWRDDSVRLAEVMTRSGSPVQLVIATGMWHVWPMSGPFPEATAALKRAAAFVRSCCR